MEVSVDTRQGLLPKVLTQTYGIDYPETSAPIAKLSTVRVLLSLASNLDLALQQLDVKNAFQNDDLHEEVLWILLQGLEDGISWFAS